MARVGRFGRLPRSAPSLTATIVAIEQAFQAARDRNIMDAWKNGGEFEGSPATDERVLAYWQDRLKGISKKDPLYDQYANTVQQFEYAVAESKNSLLYAQGKITDAERAQFFLDWAKKIDPNTEFYRTLQRNAAQFVQHVRATSGGGSGSAASKAAATNARAAADQATYNQYEGAGDLLLNMLTSLAQRMGLIPGVNPETGSAGTLADLKLTGPSGGPLAIADLLKIISGNPAAMDALRQYDPSLPDVLTQAYLEKVVNARIQGLTERRDRAAAAGDMSGDNGVTTLNKKIVQGTEWAREVGAYDTAQSYEAARTQWLSVWDDPTAAPQTKLDALAKYQATLNALADDPSTDATTAAALRREAALDTASDTLHENFTRITDPTATTQGAGNTVTKAKFDQLTAEAQTVATGETVLTFGTRAKDGTFTVDPAGKTLGPQLIGEATMKGSQLILIPQSDGSVVAAYAAPVPVVVVAKDANGVPLPQYNADQTPVAGNQGTIGYAFKVTQGGKTTTFYSYVSQGVTYYTENPPWNANATVLDEGGRIVVDVSGIVNAGTGQVTVGTKTGYVPSVAFDPIRDHAGVNHQTDTVSLVAAVIQGVGYADALAMQKAIENDPVIGQMIWQQALVAIGKIPDIGAQRMAVVALSNALHPLSQGPVRPEQDPAGYGYGYDNTTNHNAFTSVTVPSASFGQPVPSVIGRDSPFVPLAEQMVVAGRFGKPDLTGQSKLPWEDRTPVEIIKTPNSLTVPSAPLTGPTPTYVPPEVMPAPIQPAPLVQAPSPPPPPPPYDSSQIVDVGLVPAPSGPTAADLATPGATTYVPGGRIGF